MGHHEARGRGRAPGTAPAQDRGAGCLHVVVRLVVAGDSRIYEPEQLKDKEIAVTPNNGSNFTTLKMMEGFLTPEHIKTTNAGSMPKRIEALRTGKVAAVSLMEPWISVAQKQGLRILIESHSTRSEAAGDDLDGRTLAAMFRAQARAVKVIEQDPTPYIHYFIAETGGLLEPHRFQTCVSCRRAQHTRASGSKTPTAGRSREHGGAWRHL